MKVIKADPVYRRNVIVSVCMIVMCCLIAHALGIFDFSRYTAGCSNEEICERIRWLFRIAFLPMLFFGLYAILFGIKVFTSDQMPPPGTRVIKDTPVKTGTVARLYGYGAIGCGMCLTTLFLYGAFIAPAKVDTLFSGRPEYRKPVVPATTTGR